MKSVNGKMKRDEPKYVLFKKIKIDNLNFKEVYAKIKNNIKTKGYVCLMDVGVLIKATKDSELRQAVNESLISIADGMPLAWYGILLGCKQIERIAGAELMRRLMEDDNGLSHFLLGDTEQTISQVIQKARAANNNMRIEGYSPPFKEEFTQKETTTLFDKIAKANPDIIWVSFGGGKQDKWMRQNLHRLDRGVMIGVGAAFRFYIGQLKIPPQIIQSLGLQWFYRMLASPKNWIKRAAPNRLEFIVNFPIEVIKARLFGT